MHTVYSYYYIWFSPLHSEGQAESMRVPVLPLWCMTEIAVLVDSNTVAADCRQRGYRHMTSVLVTDRVRW